MKGKFNDYKLEYSFIFLSIIMLVIGFCEAVVTAVNTSTFSGFLSAMLTVFAAMVLYLIGSLHSIKRINGKECFKESTFNWLVFVVIYLEVIMDLVYFCEMISLSVNFPNRAIDAGGLVLTILSFISVITFIFASGFYKIQAGFLRSLKGVNETVNAGEEEVVSNEVADNGDSENAETEETNESEKEETTENEDASKENSESDIVIDFVPDETDKTSDNE